MSALRGNQPGWARAQADEGRVPGSLPLPRLRLFLRPSLAQQAALRELLRQQQDPTSPQYQHWLTPEEYGARFGVAPERLRALAVWLSAEGFTVTGMARGRNWIRFQGTAAQAEAAFHTELHYYRTAGRVHFANAAPPRVPAGFGGDVAAIEGLNDLLDTPGAIAAQTVSPQLDAGAGHVLAPADLATIYDFNPLWNQGITGSGVSIAVVGESDFNAADINAFRSTFGIVPTTVQTVVAAGSSDPGFNSAELEADLDLEWAGGVAPDAHLIYVEDVSALDAATYAIDQKLAPIVSESYGKCELVVASAAAAAFEAVVQQGNAEGITMVNGSGDSGPGDCDLKASSEISGGLAVHYPASVPEITAVGGTEFDEGAQAYWAVNGANGGSATGYIPEMVWDDHAFFAAEGVARLAATGGGVSVLFPQPAWQAGVSSVSTTGRLVPDIAFTASAHHDAYLVCSEAAGACSGNFPPTSFTEVGGDSAPTPMFAGILALLNQYRVSTGAAASPGLGNINPRLYALAQAMQGGGAFHDVAVGSNDEPCAAGTPNCPAGAGTVGYCAAPGYDPVSGLGSLDAMQLAQAWDAAAPAAQPGLVISTCNPAASTTAGQAASYTIALAPVGGLTGSYTLTCSGAPNNASCSVAPVSVNVAGAAAPATVTVQTAGAGGLPAAPLPSPLWLLAAGLAVLGIAGLRIADRRRWPRAAGLALLVLGFAAACGSPKPGIVPPPPPPTTPAGSYVLTLTATPAGGSSSQSLALVLTVQ